jgi:hypothetical protein
MNHPTDIPLCESLDAFAWDPDEVRDLIRTTSLRLDDNDQPAGYEADRLLDLAAAYDGRLA